ncbi:hypothetical protein HYU11_03455 [Candidatus Woesearchaeota archaeon]|nr:hypothetical protein [Candidatus Woesearchaeota archaeon]
MKKGKHHHSRNTHHIAKGQAAMEFLMTYGWAILVVLVLIGALAYFGVLSPDNFLPEKCSMPIQLSCKDFEVANKADGWDYVQVIFSNNAGRSMILRDINVTSSEAIAVPGGCHNATVTSRIPGATIVLGNGQSTTIALDYQRSGGPTMPCSIADTGRQKDRFKFKVLYSWQDSPGIIHELEGELLAKVKKW